MQKIKNQKEKKIIVSIEGLAAKKKINKTFSNLEIDTERLWIDVGPHTVSIKRESDGVVIDVFMKPKTKDDDLGEPVATTWALDNE